MVRRMSTLVAAMTLAVFLAVSLSSAQDMYKKEGDKKEGDKKAMTKEGAKLREFSCGDKCGYSVRSRDEAEVLDAAKQHVKKHHSDMAMSEKDIKGMIKDAK